MGLSLLATTDTQIIRVIEAMYNQTPGYTFLTNFRTYADENGINGFANAMGADFASQSDAEFAATITANLGLTGDALTAGNAYLEGQFAANPDARGKVVLDSMNLLAGMESDPVFGSVAAEFNSDVVSSMSYSAVTTNTTALAVGAGQTLALTTAVDALLGGSGDDTFDASLSGTSMTFGSADALDGGEGSDTLLVVVNSTSTFSTTGLNNIEMLNATFTAAGTINLLGASGVTIVEANSSTDTSKFSNIGATSVALKATAIGDDILNFGFTTAAVAGTSDTATLTLAGVEQAGSTDTIVSGIEALNVVSTNNANTLGQIIDTSLATLNVSGDQNLTVVTALGTATTVVDASQLTGELTVTTGNIAQTVTGGSGNDTIDVSAAASKAVTADLGAGDDSIDVGSDLTVADTIDGGDGADTITTSATVTVANGANVTNVETLKIVSAALGADFSQDMDAFSSAAGVTLGDTNDKDITLTDAAAGTGLTITAGNTGATGHSIAHKVDTSSDSLTLTLGTSTAAGGTQTVVSASTTELLTINSIGGANTITTLTAGDLTSLTVTGDKALTITNAIGGSTAIATVDGSAATAALDIDITSNASGTAATVTGGSGADTLTGGAGNDSISGGAGNDSLNGDDGVDTIAGEAGDDAITGGTGNDVITGGDGADTIDSESAKDNIDGGAGNDTLTFNTDADLDKDDTVDGGEGTDTADVTIATDLATKFTLTNVERVGLTSGNGLTTVDMSGVASLERLTIEDGNDAAFSVTDLISGATVKNLETDALALTIDTVADGTVTIDAAVNANAGSAFTVADADTVTVTSTSTGTTNDLTALALDTEETTSLTVTGATTTNATLATGNITASNVLASLAVTSSTSGATATVGSIADADALTSLTATADYANVTVGAIGASGTAEVLAALNLTASNGATVSLGDITADTTNSTTDNAMAITVSATSTTSTVDLDSITNTYGTLTVTATGSGDLDVGAGEALVADDITLTTSLGGSITELTATDDITVIATNSRALTIADLDSGATATASIDVTASGTAAFEVTSVTASAGTLKVDGAAATGTVDIIGTNWTGSTTLTGGSANDTLSGGTGNDVITGNAGNDSLTGAAGDDILTGGEGNDTLTLGGAGSDKLDGGAGNDTLVVTTASNLTSADTLDGGEGTDTFDITLASTTVTPVVSNVEEIDVTFGSASGGALNVGSITGATSILVDSTVAADTAATIVNVADGSTVTFGGATAANNDDFNTVTIDTVAGAGLTVVLNDDQPTLNAADGDITITDAVSVEIQQGSRTAAIWDAVVLDAVDTTSLTLTGGNAKALTVGAITGTDKLASVTVTSAASSAITTGALVDADGLTSLTLTGTGGNITFGALANDNAANNAEDLATITLAATSGSTIALGDIFADSVADAGAGTSDLDLVITASTDSTSSVDFDAIANNEGTITVTATGSGDFDIGTATSTLATATLTANLSAATGTNTVNIVDVTGSGSITLAAGDGADTIVLGLGGVVSVTGFETGTGGDVIAIDLSATVAMDANSAALGVTAAGATTLVDVTGNAQTNTSGEIFILTGTSFATTALAEAAIEATGTRDLTFDANITAGDDVIFVWSDGANSHVGIFDVTATAGSQASAGALTELIELVGVDVSTAGTITAANFSIVA